VTEPAAARIALVGCGIWGAKMLDELGRLDVALMVVDTSAEVRGRAEARGVAVAPTVEEAAEHAVIDGWVVATPATTHTQVLDTITRVWLPDARVFCEKPFTVDLASAERLAEVLGDRCSLGHVWRYHPGVELLGALARDGAIGEVHGIRTTRANWTSPRTDTDTIWNMVPHDITIAIEILGHIPEPRAAVVDGMPRALGMWALLGGEGEPFLVVEATNRVADKRREIRVHGRGGVAVLPDLEVDYVEIWRGVRAAPDIERVPFTPLQPLRRELEIFVSSLTGGAPPKSDAAEGVAVVRTITQLRALAGLNNGP
jgi:predicted dehydrogenase